MQGLLPDELIRQPVVVGIEQGQPLAPDRGNAEITGAAVPCRSTRIASPYAASTAPGSSSEPSSTTTPARLWVGTTMETSMSTILAAGHATGYGRTARTTPSFCLTNL